MNSSCSGSSVWGWASIGSGKAATVAALKLARSLRQGTIVTVFPDFGDKYLSTNLWIGWQEWRRERLAQVLSKWNASTNVIT